MQKDIEVKLDRIFERLVDLIPRINKAEDYISSLKSRVKDLENRKPEVKVNPEVKNTDIKDLEQTCKLLVKNLEIIENRIATISKNLSVLATASLTEQKVLNMIDNRIRLFNKGKIK
jgi:chromosome segregation ATPase